MQPAWNSERFATLEARAAEIDTIYALVATTMTERTTDEWLKLFVELEIPAAPLNTPADLFDNEHLNAVGFFETVQTPHGVARIPGVPTWFSRTPAGWADRHPTGRRHRRGARRAGPRRGGAPVTLDFDMGPEAAALRRRLRGLIAEQMPEGFLGAFTDDPADLAAAQRFCRVLADEGLLCLAWPPEFGDWAPRCGNRPWSARRWATTNRAAPSTWESTGWARR